MKKSRKLLSLLLAVFMTFSLPGYACMPVSAASEISAETVKDQTKTLTMVKGQKTTIKPPVKMTYTSSNAKIASVNSKGVITANSKGSAVITGSCDSAKWIYKVKVEQPKLSSTAISMTAGNTRQLKLSGTTRKQVWSSGNSKVASVSSSGKVTAKAAGAATVTVTVNGIKFRCKVTVKAKAPVKPVTQSV